MLVAYLAYQERFSGSISNLTDMVFSWRMLDIYNTRLADIVLSQNEEQLHQPHSAGGNLRDCSPDIREFTPAEAEPPLTLNSISFFH